MSNTINMTPIENAKEWARNGMEDSEEMEMSAIGICRRAMNNSIYNQSLEYLDDSGDLIEDFEEDIDS